MRALILSVFVASCGCPVETLCPSGCYDSDGVCQSGDTTSACGADGRSCVVCGAGERCGVSLLPQGRTCWDPCTEANCAGCCTAENECVSTTSGACR